MQGRDAWRALELVEDAAEDVALKAKAGLHLPVKTDFADVCGAAEERLEGVEAEPFEGGLDAGMYSEAPDGEVVAGLAVKRRLGLGEAAA